MAIFLDLKGTTQSTVQFGKGGPKIQSSTGDFHFHTPNLADYVDIFANVLRATGNELVLNANAPNSGSNYKYTVKRPTSGMTSQLTLHLPPNYGSSGQFLQSDGAGNTSWASAGGGASGFTELTGPVNLTGTYNGFLRVIGDATVTGNVTVKGDLKVTGKLNNPSNYSVIVDGNALIGVLSFSPSIGFDGGSLSVGGSLALTGSVYNALDNLTTQNIAQNSTIAGYSVLPNFGISLSLSSGSPNTFAGDWTSLVVAGDIFYGNDNMTGPIAFQVGSVLYDSMADTTDITVSDIWSGVITAFSVNCNKNPDQYGATAFTSTNTLPNDTVTLMYSGDFSSFITTSGVIYGSSDLVTYNSYTVVGASYIAGQTVIEIVNPAGDSITNVLFINPYTTTTALISAGLNSVDEIGGVVTLYDEFQIGDQVKFWSGVNSGATKTITSKFLSPDGVIYLNLNSSVTSDPSWGGVIANIGIDGSFTSSITGIYATVSYPSATGFGPTDLFCVAGTDSNQSRTIVKRWGGYAVLNTPVSAPTTYLASSWVEKAAAMTILKISSGSISPFLKPGDKILFNAGANNFGYNLEVIADQYSSIQQDAFGTYYNLAWAAVSPRYLPQPEISGVSITRTREFFSDFKLNQGTTGSVSVGGNFYLNQLDGSGASGYNAKGIDIDIKGSLIGVDVTSPPKSIESNQFLFGYSPKAQLTLNGSGSSSAKSGGTLNVGGDILNFALIALNGNNATGASSGSLVVGGSVNSIVLNMSSMDTINESGTFGSLGEITVGGNLISTHILIAGSKTSVPGSMLGISISGNLSDDISNLSVYNGPSTDFYNTIYGYSLYNGLFTPYTGGMMFYQKSSSASDAFYTSINGDLTCNTKLKYILSGNPAIVSSRSLRISQNLSLGGLALSEIKSNLFCGGIIKIGSAKQIMSVGSYYGLNIYSWDLSYNSPSIDPYTSAKARYVLEGIKNHYGVSGFAISHDGECDIIPLSNVGLTITNISTTIIGLGTKGITISGGGGASVYVNANPPVGTSAFYYVSCRDGYFGSIQAVRNTNPLSAQFSLSLSNADCGTISIQDTSGSANSFMTLRNCIAGTVSMTDTAASGASSLTLDGNVAIGSATVTNRADMNIVGSLYSPTTLSIKSLTGKTTLKNNTGTQTGSITSFIADSIFYLAGSASSVWKRIQGSSI